LILNIELIGIMALLIGTLSNLFKLKVCFIFWSCSNLIFLFKAYLQGDTTYQIVFSILLISSILGYKIYDMDLKINLGIRNWIRRSVVKSGMGKYGTNRMLRKSQTTFLTILKRGNLSVKNS